VIEPTDEMVQAVEAVDGLAYVHPDLARRIAAAVLAIVERDLPRCPHVEWGLKVRLCSLPIGHGGSHELNERVLS